MTALRKIDIKGVVDTVNSSTTPLGIGGVFTGTATEILNYGIIFVTIYSDVASATDGLSIQQSTDGTNWEHTDDYTVEASSAKNFSINPYAKYVRVVYTNGAVGQATFRLQTILKGNSKPSSHRIQDSITTADDAELMKAVLTAELDGDGFDNIKATASGNLKTTDAENGLAIAKGDVTGTTFIHKFGNAPDFDTVNGLIDVWDGADDAEAWTEPNYTYSTTADIDRISSTSGSDTFDVEIQGLDTNYDLVVQTKTLTGQTGVALDTPLIRVFRMKNVGTSDNVGHVFCYVNVATTGGVPNTTANIRAVIQSGNNQTLMALYTIPAGYTGYMRDWFASTAKASKDAAYSLELRARPFGQVFQLKHLSAINEKATSLLQHVYTEPERFSEKTDIVMKVQVITSSITEASVSAGFDVVLIAN